VCDRFLKWADGSIKLLVTAAGLRLRREHPASFLEGDYVPLRADVTVPGDVVAFARVGGESPAVVAIVPRLVARLMGADAQPPLGGDAWKTSRVMMPEALKSRRFTDAITGREIPIVHGNGEAWIFVGEALRYCPVALLVQI
jgi:(1->4)-alpha-D-glucan 1-alpha-D-glucosylmutase